MGGPAAERADADPDGSRRSQGRLSLPSRLLARLARALGPGRALVAILDYDGTLTPIVGRPEAARLALATRATLAALAAHPRVTLAVLSGRALADVRRRVGVAGAVYGGCHGLEIAGPDLRRRHPAARRAPLAAARRMLARAARELPGARVEWKGLAVSFHYRQVAAARRGEAHAVAARVARRWPGLVVVAGHRVYDFVPRVGWTKGHAARWIVARATPGRPGRAAVVYAGDDTTDEAAFVALKGRAVTVRVGPGPTAADHRVRGVRDVHAMLRWIVAALA
ncbi:MAG: trehalose-phosphatase [Candidatus Rokubacteria bacterium]|nr:trehalose-phosphatase [Candidatus Rokubacteria bacterium]